MSTLSSSKICRVRHYKSYHQTWENYWSYRSPYSLSFHYEQE